MDRQKHIDAVKATRLYNEGLTSTEVGRHFGVSHNIVLRHLRELGTFIRPRRWKGGTHVTSDGYVFIRKPGHPKAIMRGYVLRAILAWEKANGKSFPKGKFPHHINGIKIDDRPENILPITRAEHARLHIKMPGGLHGQSIESQTFGNNVENKKPGYQDGIGREACS